MTNMMFHNNTICISNTIQHSDKRKKGRSFYVNCKSLEIKLKKEMLKIDLILQFISALLSFEILSESRDKKNIAIKERQVYYSECFKFGGNYQIFANYKNLEIKLKKEMLKKVISRWLGSL